MSTNNLPDLSTGNNASKASEETYKFRKENISHNIDNNISNIVQFSGQLNTTQRSGRNEISKTSRQKNNKRSRSKNSNKFSNIGYPSLRKIKPFNAMSTN